MLEVACAVCGAVYRFSSGDVPPGGKTVTCAKCKSRIVVQAPPPPPPMMGGTGDIIDLGPAIGGPVDVPRATADILDLPAPRLVPSSPADILDLPAPRSAIPAPTQAHAAPPTASAPPQDVLDLPAPRLVPRGQADALTLDNIDLLAPVGPTRSRTPSASPPVLAPEPSPRGRVDASAIPDLPAPKRSAEPARPPFVGSSGSVASPQAMPGPPAAAPRGPDVPDLPTPKYGGPARDLFDDLPNRAPSLADLPAPKRASARTQPPPYAATRPPASPGAPGSTDLPAPKGFFDDLPQPASAHAQAGVTDLPAPKGFFDDLPQPASAQAQGRPDLPAPKGFFDDLPQSAPPQAQGRPDLPAPKGFFDDLPQSAPPQAQGRPDLPAPKGFFDDLPQSAPQGRSDVPAPKGFFDDLPQPGYAASGVDLPIPRELLEENAQRARTTRTASDLGRAASEAGRYDEPAPPLDLGDEQLSGLDLPSVDGSPATAGRAGVVSFRASGGDDDGRPSTGLRELDLAQPAKREETTGAKGPARVEVATRPPRNLRRIALIGGLAIALAGAGGYAVYDRWQAKKARAAAMEKSLGDAHRALVAGDAGHWGRALSAAKQVLEKSPKHADALATAALAQLAGYYDQGTNREARVKAGRNLLEQARLASAHGPSMTKALALDALIEGDAKAAIDRLTPLVPGDGEALLYLGWAQLAAQHWDDAAGTFDKAIAATPGRKLVATYGRGWALLGKGDREGAHAQFLAVIAADAEHVGAQVGVAAARPPAEFLDREKELLAILQRPKIENADPRVRALAWKLAGDDARSAGRLDAARERYRKALELQPDDVATIVAAAALELRDGKLEPAATGIDRALTLAPEDVDANLVKIELDIKRASLDTAAERIEALRGRTPPIAPAAQGRLEMLDGDRLAATGDGEAAVAAYGKARDALGKGDIGPTIAIATQLGRMAAAADKAGKPDDAAALRKRATGELAELAGAATADPALAVTLGVAYLDAGGLADAEMWLRSAIASRPTDVEAHFQLAECLRRAGKASEAIDMLKRAFALAPARVDLGLSLARAYEEAGRDADARTAYGELLKAGDDASSDAAQAVPLEVRVRAGRFFARVGDAKLGDKARAGKEGEAILAIEADNAAGHFLKAEGLLAGGHLDDARREFQRAADRDPDPQFLDGLGRGWEAIFLDKGDTQARDEALRAYLATTNGRPLLTAPPTLRPILLHATAAAGRLLMHRQEYEKAIPQFEAVNTIAPSADLEAGIGQAYNRLGNKREAMKHLALAAKGDPPGETLYALGLLYKETNQAGAAATMLDRATTKGAREEKVPGSLPWLTDAYSLLGDTLERAGREEEACRAYRGWLARNPSDEAKIAAVKQIMFGLRGCR